MENESSEGAATNISINDVVSFHDKEKVMYCRLCATVNNDAVSIFGEEGVRLNLADKINVSLPIWVSSNMGPPLHVCRKCIDNLNATVNFINQVVAAQKKINTVFKVLQDISKRNVPTTRETNIPAFITYFRAKNFKKLDTMRRMPGNETEKENGGGNPKKTVIHSQKMVDDGSLDYLPSGKGIIPENKASTADTTSMNLISDDILEEDDAREDIIEPAEDDLENSADMTTGDETNAEVMSEKDSTFGYHKDSIKSSEEVYQNVCKYCEKSFKWNTELLFHLTNVHEDVVFCCRVCRKVFYDDNEKFTNHVKSHSEGIKEADPTEISQERTPLESDVSKTPREESGCNTLSQNKNQDQVRMKYICKYCSRKYAKLHDLFSHQTEDHSDLVFRCSYCSKVFYENEEELLKHEESHGIHMNKFKSSEGIGADETKTIKNSSCRARVVYSNLTKKQQDWVNRILSDKPKKISVQNNVNTNILLPVNVNASISPPVNGNANISLPVGDRISNSPTGNVTTEITPSKNVAANDSPPGNVDTKILPSLNMNTSAPSPMNVDTEISPAVNCNSAVTLDNQVQVDNSAKVKSHSNVTTVYSVRVLDHVNATKRPRVACRRRKKYVCRACQVEFKTEEERELHRLFHHRFKLPCRYCPRTLAHKSKLLDHEATHFKKPKLTCKKCREEFESVEMLKKHRRTHCITHTLPRFSCQICKRMYVREKELKIHLETHLDERPFLCEKCGQCFKDVATLREHRSTPCGSKGFAKGYECEICEKKFNNARLLVCHRIQQHRAIYPCPLCGLVFRSRPAMITHMKNHSKILCLVCDEGFDTLEHLQSHRKQKHPDEEMVEFSAFDNLDTTNPVSILMCEVCEECFASELTLNVHKATHLGESAWQCQICSERFDSKFHLEQHMSSHPRERPHKCSICDQTFSNHERLRQHIKVHFRERGQVCGKCGKSFSTTTELSKHLAMHSTYSAFSCSFCSMTFSRKISLLIHQRSHTNKIYSCLVCSEKFSHPKFVEQHERTHSRSKINRPVTSTKMEEDSLAPSLLEMSRPVERGDSVTELVLLGEDIPSANIISGDGVEGKDEGSSNVIIDSEYSEVVYVSNAIIS